jgi:hypothetical protein
MMDVLKTYSFSKTLLTTLSLVREQESGLRYHVSGNALVWKFAHRHFDENAVQVRLPGIGSDTYSCSHLSMNV